MHDPPQYEAGKGTNTLSFPFHDGFLSNVLDSEDEEQHQRDLIRIINPYLPIFDIN